MISVTSKINLIEKFLGKGILSKDAINFNVTCPFCNSRSNVKKLKLCIRVDNDLWHCWVCGRKGKNLTRILRQAGANNQEISNYERENHVYSPFNDVSSNEEINEVVDLPHGFELLATANVKDPEVRYMKKYLEKRGLTSIDEWRYRIGFTEKVPQLKYRVIIPSFSVEGKLNYWIARSVYDHMKPKYVNPKNKKNKIIFNECDIIWDDPIILCEGVFDMMKCGWNAVPLLGSDIKVSNPLFTAIVTNRCKVILILDEDMKNTKTLQMFELFSKYDVDTSVVDMTGYNDPGSNTKEKMQELITKAKKITWSEAFFTKLNFTMKKFSLAV